MHSVQEKLSESISSRINGYSSPEERSLRIAGKILLAKVLAKQDSKQSLTLNDLHYDEWGKPYLKGGKMKFSITHSGNLVVCGCTNDQKPVGIDAEKLKPIRLADIEDYLTGNERQWLQAAPDMPTPFYELWTRKEAILKASGRGVGIPFAEVEVLGNPVVLNEHKWHWQCIPIHPDYCIHLATAQPENVDVQEIIL